MKVDYDYYKSIRDKSNMIFNKKNLCLYIPNWNAENLEKLELIYREKFYHFILNLFNKKIFDLDFSFNEDELNFFIDFKIDSILEKTIALCKEDIQHYKKVMCHLE